MRLIESDFEAFYGESNESWKRESEWRFEIEITVKLMVKFVGQFDQFWWILAIPVDSGNSGGFWQFWWILAILVDSGNSSGFWQFQWILAIPVDSGNSSGFGQFQWILAIPVDSGNSSGFCQFWWIPTKSQIPFIPSKSIPPNNPPDNQHAFSIITIEAFPRSFAFHTGIESFDLSKQSS
jgi:hypothetical protein